MKKEDVEQYKIFEFVRGSQAYGTSTPESDEDIGGIFMPPRDVILGVSKVNVFDKWQDESGEKIDKSMYNMNSAFDLFIDNNPNMLDFLFAPERCIKFTSPTWERIREIRDEFLCTKAKFTFTGYAYAQLKRLESHRTFLKHPIEKKPERAEFGLPETSMFPETQIEVTARLSSQYVKEEDRDAFMNDITAIMHSEGALTFKKYIAPELYPLAITDFKRGMHNFLRMISSLSGHFLKDEYQDMANKELQFLTKMKEWDAFSEWKKNRNAKRAEIEAKTGFDCYIDGTEFLTDTGFKSFDVITDSDKLATVLWDTDGFIYESRPKFSVEYQNYTDKFDALYNGSMYQFTGVHNNCVVTANHNMLYQKEERNTGVKYGWRLGHASHIPDCFNVLNTCTPKTKTYTSKHLFNDISVSPEVYLRIMGWYLSDGTMTFSKTKSEDKFPKAIVISQRKNNKLYPYMVRFAKKYKNILTVSMTGYMKKPNVINATEKEEFLLHIYDKKLVTKLYNDCGHYSHLKRIPRYVMGLSKNLKEVLFDAMVGGDGTIRTHKSIDDNIVYYTNNTLLADDVQELCYLAGWKSSKWGPYHYDNRNSKLNENYPMHHVFVDKNVEQTVQFTRSGNVNKHDVTNQRIYCFSVPNSALVTRYKGEISMHGNCKHASHLIRLGRMSNEILECRGVLVDRTNIDRDYLLQIRNGHVQFDVILAESEALNKKADELYKTTSLRRTPNLELINNLRMTLLEEELFRNRT